MTEFFLSVVNGSISASYLILAVLLLRLLLKKAPKWVHVLLWGIVALRLLCPFSIESMFSLIPSTETLPPTIMADPTPQLNTGIPVLNNALNPILEHSFTPSPGDSVNPLQIWLPALSVLWLAGMLGMLVYVVVSYLRLRIRLATAVRREDGSYQSENASTPFILGFFSPKIYLPFAIPEDELPLVLAHEKAHLQRKDHWWKPLGYLLLTLHWFNPLMWLGYVLLCRDIELACDEKVIGKLNRSLRADYSSVLLKCSVNRRSIAACPLAFGELGVKERIRSVLNYKKPPFWILTAALVACMTLTVCFLTNPAPRQEGVNALAVEKSSAQGMTLSFSYLHPTGGYTVCPVGEEEGEYLGDGKKDYDGSLGKYRVLITFGDTAPSEEFQKRFPAGQKVEIASSPILLNAKRVHPEDHGFSLYLGSDTPFTSESLAYTPLDPSRNEIRISLSLLVQEETPPVSQTKPAASATASAPVSSAPAVTVSAPVSSAPAATASAPVISAPSATASAPKPSSPAVSATEPESSAPAATEHRHRIVIDPAVAATCKEPGLTEGSHCATCNQVLTAQKTVPLANHSPVTDPAVAATCKDVGLTEGSHCKVCNQVLTEQKTLPLSTVHTPVIDPVINPTCQRTGRTQGSHCSTCHKILKEQTIVPKVSYHIYVDNLCECGALKESDKIAYVFNGKGYSIRDIGNCTDGRIVIPASIDGYPVTEIQDKAFFGAKFIYEILLPDSITHIGKQAFSGCTALKSIRIPAGVTCIEYECFASCQSLEKVEIPDGVTLINKRAFYNCRALKSVHLPDSLVTIGESAFSYCASLESASLPQWLNEIEKYAFCNCPKLAFEFRGSSWAFDRIQKGLGWDQSTLCPGYILCCDGYYDSGGKN